MRYHTLIHGLPPSSALGFGCGSVVGRIGRKQSSRALAAALDAGITHFDVARSYGYGEAEALLGDVLASRRDRVVIATKFGIMPSSSARALKRLKPLAQSVIRVVPALRPLIRSAVRPWVGDARRFSPAAARASLDKSLRALQTDYIDILLVHECAADEFGNEVLDFLAAEREAGRIRAYGVATNTTAVANLAALHGMQIIYQFPDAVTNRNLELHAANVRPRITHSPFAGAKDVARVLAHGVEISLERRRVGPEDTHQLMLSYALRSNAEGVVVLTNPLICTALGYRRDSAGFCNHSTG